MIKYVIHACPERMWYVNDYLVPSLQAQGIDNIVVECDDKRLGNLKHCMRIFSHITYPGGAWHLQDDVIICRDFKKRTEECNDLDVVCGFVIKQDKNVDKVGYVKPEDMWWSFPCIYIPNHLARECAYWVDNVAKYKSIYSWMIRANRYDDSLFKEFLIDCYPNYQILNLTPNLVDHIDYLVGGTTINQGRTLKDIRSAFFEDTDLVDELEKKIGLENVYQSQPFYRP